MHPDFSKIPSMDSLLSQLHDLSSEIDLIFIKQLTENLINEIKINPAKQKILYKNRREISDFIVNEIKKVVNDYLKPTFNKVINGTGVILHTGLGRAPLAVKTMQDLLNVSGYTNLEINRTTGKRGERLDHVGKLLQILTGADDSVVVNNNAAAVLLVLNSLAKRKEIIVSRGELVEIGGSFRMHEVMNSSGAKMIEVGSTNKTHLDDYEQAINTKTAAILLVHPSNYKIVGFTKKPETRDILSLAQKHNIPVIFDLGSGAFIDMSQFGFEYEPVVRDVIDMGFDIITFPGTNFLEDHKQALLSVKKIIWIKLKRIIYFALYDVINLVWLFCPLLSDNIFIRVVLQKQMKPLICSPETSNI